MIFVGIPCFDGKVCTETVRSLLNEQAAAGLLGIHLEIRFLSGCSLIPQARNQIATEFMESGAEKLVFIDADVAWEPGALIRVASHDVDFVGGAYRLKQDVEAYPVNPLSAPGQERGPLIEVGCVPGGFMCLTRKVFETIGKPEYEYTHLGRTFTAYFHVPRGGGEDTAFCLDWRAAGGTVWLDPDLTLTHVGGNPKYTGTFRDWLKGR